MTQNLHTDPSHEAEETLRLVAQLPPPANLTERLHRRIEDARAVSPRRGFWSLWMPAQRLQYAGAALLVLAIAGSAWTMRHTGPAKGPISSPPAVQPLVQPEGAGFGPASSEARPSNLKPIKVPPAPKKKPSASKVMKKRTLQPGAQAAGDSKASANE